MPYWFRLLRIIGSPFVEANNVYFEHFSWKLYRLAKSNKVVLSYLSGVNKNNVIMRRLYEQDSLRLKVLLGVMCDVCNVFNSLGIDYVVFKTLRPYKEEVADVDILCLAGEKEYKKMIDVVAGKNYRLMEKGFYCTTFEDPRYRFETEVMIDLYSTVSVGPLVYLDKGLLEDHVVMVDAGSCKVRVLDPVAELLVLIAHSVIKEGRYILAEYLSTLHYLASMDEGQLEEFIDLVRRAKLTYASKVHLSITAYLHRIAHGFIPDKLEHVLDALGGPIIIPREVLYSEPPYSFSSRVLARVFAEKLRDPVFRKSIIKTLAWLSYSGSLKRLIEKFLSRMKRE